MTSSLPSLLLLSVTLTVFLVAPANCAQFNGVEHQNAGDKAWDIVFPEIKKAIVNVSNSRFLVDHFFKRTKRRRRT